MKLWHFENVEQIYLFTWTWAVRHWSRQKPQRALLMIAGAIFLNACTLPVTSPPPRAITLMPYPAHLTFNAGEYELTPHQKVYFEHIAPPRQQLILQWLRTALPSATFQLADTKEGATMVIAAEQPLDSPYPHLGVDETYQLQINEKLIVIEGATPYGALHGVQTLRQLFYRFGSTLPALEVEDSPAYPWRGMMVDSVRHFIPLKDLKRQIEGMASAKLNVFHWHLTDDQGWRVESNAYPLLQQKASDGLYYTQQEIRELVDFARLRGIRVVPEFDVPGHATAIAVAYPQLMAQPGRYELERHWGVFKPLLDPSNPRVYQFIDTMVAELALLFPDQYIHIGGDEVNPHQWEHSAAVGKYMQDNQLADFYALHAHFNEKVQAILARHNRKMMGWDEIFHPSLSPDVVVQSWRGHESLQKITQQGYKGLLSTGFYIDQPQRTGYHYRNHPRNLASPQILEQDRVTVTGRFTVPRLKGSPVKGRIWLAGSQAVIQLNNQPPQVATVLAMDQYKLMEFDSWMGPLRLVLNSSSNQFVARLFIGNAPYPVEGQWLEEALPLPEPVAAFTPAVNKNILGGEAALWSEIVTPDNIDLRVWPRLYAIAERLWSPAHLVDEQRMYQRLQKVSDYAALLVGLKHQEQARNGFRSQLNLAGDARVEHLLKLSNFVEQAQYYTRHHLKFRADQYHQQAPLNQLVDFLPAESVQVARTETAILALMQSKGDEMPAIRAQFSQWQQDVKEITNAARGTSWETQINELMKKSDTAISTALNIIDSCQQLQDPMQVQTYRETLQHIGKIRTDETIIAPAYLAELLLMYCE